VGQLIKEELLGILVGTVVKRRIAYNLCVNSKKKLLEISM